MSYALAGNYCASVSQGSRDGLKRGNGRVVIAKLNTSCEENINGFQGDACCWDVVKVVHLPKEAFLLDYAGETTTSAKGHKECLSPVPAVALFGHILLLIMNGIDMS